MDGLQADPDALRALAELSRRQARHVENIADYMHRVCTASGSFGGFSVLNLFEGTYKKAFGYAEQGLQASVTTNNRAAESFEECAAAYETADRAVYDVFARIAGGAGWDVDPFRPAGSGNTAVGAGACVSVEAGKKDGEGDPMLAGVPVVGAALGAADSVATFTSDHVDPLVKGTIEAGLRDTGSTHGVGGPTPAQVFVDDAKAANIKLDESALDKNWSNGDQALGAVGDPGGAARDALQKKLNVTERLGMDNHFSGTPTTHHSIKTAVDVYSTGKDVLELRSDPTMGVSDAWKELDQARDTRGRLEDLSDDAVENSATTWGARP